MGQKLYEWPDEGGIVFASERKPWNVCIPIFIYDLWLPLLGVEVVGVYSVYCRLEMAGEVKKMTQAKLAQACRIGTRRLAKINEMLEDCGFITVEAPQGQDRLKHFTTKIILKDPPQKVSQELIDKYHQLEKSDYEPLTTWLIADEDSQVKTPEMSNDNAGDVKRQHDALSNDNAKIGTLGVEELGVLEKPRATPAEIDAATYDEQPPVVDAERARRILDLPTHYKRSALAGLDIPLVQAFGDAMGAPCVASEAEKITALEATIAGYTPDDMKALVKHKLKDRPTDKPYRLAFALSDLSTFKAQQITKPKTSGKVLSLDQYEYGTPEYWREYERQMTGESA